MVDIEFSADKISVPVYRFILSNSEMDRVIIPYDFSPGWSGVYRKTLAIADNGWYLFYLEKFEPFLTEEDVDFWY